VIYHSSIAWNEYFSGIQQAEDYFRRKYEHKKEQ